MPGKSLAAADRGAATMEEVRRAAWEGSKTLKEDTVNVAETE